MPPAALTSYAILLRRLDGDLAELRRSSTNLDTIAPELRRLQVHISAELAAVARAEDREVKQRERAAQGGASSR
jgi:hypothetical protein